MITTPKDHMRMERLIAYCEANGEAKAIEKAERDAAKIGEHDKAEARGTILKQRGYPRLAEVFFTRHQTLKMVALMTMTGTDG